MTRTKGFTLIELLVVVAIISILAAIALPNFLEATTRSKTARAAAELNVYASAMEVYFLDHNTFIPSACPDRSLARADQTTQWYRSLTTPIAYLTTLPLDPFSRLESISWNGAEGMNPYHIYTGTGKGLDNRSNPDNMIRATYLIASMGPNLDNDTTVRSVSGSDFVLACAKEGVPTQSLTTLRPYDTTNGTKSVGDIYRYKDGYGACCFDLVNAVGSPTITITTPPRPG